MNTQAVQPRSHRHGWWWKALVGGFVLWVATIAVTAQTGNSNLVPTLILLGSFLVPFSVVLFAAERVGGTLVPVQLFLAFFVGGIFGVLGASVLESELHPTPWIYFRVGFIEELVKGVILLFVGRSVLPRQPRLGALVGACVGAGFAAFESAGYAFNSALTQNGIDLGSLLQTEVMRSVMTPLGHVLWTALLGAVVFGAAARAPGGRYRLTAGVLVAYVAVSVLHGLWDSMGGIAAFLAVLVTGNAVPALDYGFLRPGSDQTVASLSSEFYLAGLAAVSVIGLVALRLALARRARR